MISTRFWPSTWLSRVCAATTPSSPRGLGAVVSAMRFAPFGSRAGVRRSSVSVHAGRARRVPPALTRLRQAGNVEGFLSVAVLTVRPAEVHHAHGGPVEHAARHPHDQAAQPLVLERGLP